MHSLDSQQKELIGRAALEAELIRQGFEVARPHRDRGIDLIVYLDRSHHFAALPVQMKASSGTAFGAWLKFERVQDLVVAYIWNVQTKTPRFFVMSGHEAIRLIPSQRKKTKAWTASKSGGWRWPKAPAAIARRLRPYDDRWEWLRGRLEVSHVREGARSRPELSRRSGATR